MRLDIKHIALFRYGCTWKTEILPLEVLDPSNWRETYDNYATGYNYFNYYRGGPLNVFYR